MKIAGIQFACLDDKESNTEKALKIMDMAVKEGARIICFQEIFNLKWFPKARDRENFDLAEEISGKTIRKAMEKARECEVVILLPFFEREGDRYYNSCAIINSKGALAGIYRKIHVPDIPLWEEKFYFSIGDKGFPVFKTEYGNIGVQISWDNLYPEGARILASKGADIIFSPTACAFKSQNIWKTVISGNAITNGIYIMRVNRVGSEESLDFYGMSFCVNPEGEIVGGPTGTGGDSVLIADVDYDYLQRLRREWPILKERRPEQYTEILGG